MTGSSVAASAASLLGSRLTVAVIALLFLGVSTRLLTLEEMALFALYNSLAGLVTVLCSFGLLAAGVREIPAMMAADRRIEAAALIRLSLLVQSGVGILWTTIVAAAAGPLSGLILKTADFAPEVRLAAIAALCFGMHDALQLVLNGLQRYDRISSNNVITAIAQRVLSLACFFLFGVRGYIGGFAAGSLVGAALGLRASADAMTVRGRMPPGWRRRQIAWAAPFYADGYLRYLYMQADQIIVGVLLTPGALSVYFIAKRFLQYVQMLVQSLLEPIGTRVAGMRRTGAGRIPEMFARTSRAFFAIFVPGSMILAGCSPLLLHLIGGARYESGVIPLALLFLSMIPFAFFSHVSAFVFVLGEPGDRLRTNLVSAAAQCGSMFVFLPWFGLAGLAVARAIGFSAGSARAMALLRMRGTSPATSWFEGRVGGGFVIAAAAGTATALPWLVTGESTLIPLALVPASVLCAIAFIRYILTRHERAALASLIPGTGGAATRLRAGLMKGR